MFNITTHYLNDHINRKCSRLEIVSLTRPMTTKPNTRSDSPLFGSTYGLQAQIRSHNKGIPILTYNIVLYEGGAIFTSRIADKLGPVH